MNTCFALGMIQIDIYIVFKSSQKQLIVMSRNISINAKFIVNGIFWCRFKIDGVCSIVFAIKKLNFNIIP